jgi:DNA polymerase/3'-5' exonuclease PolX
MNETATKQPEKGFEIPDLLKGAEERETALEASGRDNSAILPQLAAAKAAGDIRAARQTVASIEGHFTKSHNERSVELDTTNKMIADLQEKINEDMAVFVDLSHRISVRTQQVAELRTHAIRLAMERTLFTPTALEATGKR